MAYKNLNAINIVNVINAQVNKEYNTSLPAVNKANFSGMADQLRVAAPNIQNAWQDALVNLVGMQLTKTKRAYESYFRKLHLGETATENIQLMMADLVAARTFNPNADSEDFFEDAKLDLGVQYVTSTVKAVFPVSINEETLYAAFLSPETFMGYFNNMVDSQLVSSLEMFDTQTVKQLISQNVSEGNIFLIPMTKPVDQTTALAFTAQLKAVAADMAVEMSPKYNLAGFNTWTPKDEGVIIADTDTQAVTQTYSLAWAFNKSYVDWEGEGNAITMANDSICDGAVFALYADRYAFEIRNKVGFPKTVSQYFGNTLTLKRWLHYQAIYAVSYFNNIVGFADSSKIDSSASATLALRDGSTAVNPGAKGQVYVSALTVTSGKVFDKFGTYTITGATDTKTAIDAKAGKLVIGKNETGSDVSGLTGKYITVTWTSHLDANTTATLNIKINQ